MFKQRARRYLILFDGFLLKIGESARKPSKDVYGSRENGKDGCRFALDSAPQPDSSEHLFYRVFLEMSPASAFFVVVTRGDMIAFNKSLIK